MRPPPPAGPEGDYAMWGPGIGALRIGAGCVVCLRGNSLAVASSGVHEPAHLLTTRASYDAVADDYARLLPDLRAETDLDRAMLARLADLLWPQALDQ